MAFKFIENQDKSLMVNWRIVIVIDKNIIDEALEFYNIDLQYRNKCFNCIEEINKNEKLSLLFKYNITKKYKNSIV